MCGTKFVNTDYNNRKCVNKARKSQMSQSLSAAFNDRLENDGIRCGAAGIYNLLHSQAVFENVRPASALIKVRPPKLATNTWCGERRTAPGRELQMRRPMRCARTVRNDRRLTNALATDEPGRGVFTNAVRTCVFGPSGGRRESSRTFDGRRQPSLYRVIQ